MTPHPAALNASPKNTPKLDARSLHLRRLILRGLEGGGGGHIGSSMSLVEILRVLYDDIMNYRVTDPEWPGRDRCILSKGHGCLALYAILADYGFFSAHELDSFTRPSALLGGHPDPKVPGVEWATGSLGHGPAPGIGMALAARIQNRESRVFVICGDGELDEGSVWEACLAAAHHQLTNYTLIIDYNKIQSAGPVSEIVGLEPLVKKFLAFGFECIEVDGHDTSKLRAALSLIQVQNKPKAVIAHTVKGKGIPFAEHDPLWHHKAEMTKHDIEQLSAALELGF